MSTAPEGAKYRIVQADRDEFVVQDLMGTDWSTRHIENSLSNGYAAIDFMVKSRKPEEVTWYFNVKGEELVAA
jgi:hypothetical protein